MKHLQMHCSKVKGTQHICTQPKNEHLYSVHSGNLYEIHNDVEYLIGKILQTEKRGDSITYTYERITTNQYLKAYPVVITVFF